MLKSTVHNGTFYDYLSTFVECWVENLHLKCSCTRVSSFMPQPPVPTVEAMDCGGCVAAPGWDECDKHYYEVPLHSAHKHTLYSLHPTIKFLSCATVHFTSLLMVPLRDFSSNNFVSLFSNNVCDSIDSMNSWAPTKLNQASWFRFHLYCWLWIMSSSRKQTWRMRLQNLQCRCSQDDI